MRPALVAVSHRTRDPADPQVVANLLDDVRRRLPGVEVVTGWVEPVTARVGKVISQMPQAAVIVPLHLSMGYPIMTDVSSAAQLSGAPVHVAAPLGPDRHLARVMTSRLREAGGLWGDSVVLAAASPTDPAGLADVEKAARLLASEWGPWVTHSCLSGPGPDVATTVEQLRQTGAGRVCVAPYLLAPGRFSQKGSELAAAAGATRIASVLGGHRLVTDLVVRRYQQGVRALATNHRAA